MPTPVGAGAGAAAEPVDQAAARFAAAGYRHRFELAEGRLVCSHCGAGALPADFALEATVAVSHGAHGPGTLFALECMACSVKGVWLVVGAGPAELAAVVGLRDGRPRDQRP